MPWSISKRDNEYCVQKDSDKSIAGCHNTREGAEKQIAALYASEAEKKGNFAMYNEETFNEMEGYMPKPGLPIEHVEAMLNVAMDLKKQAKTIFHQHFVPKYSPAPSPESHRPMMYSDDGELMELLAAGNKEEYAWEGPIVFEGVLTGDNRVFKAGSISWDAETLPWPFRWQKESTKGHDGAVAIGRVDKLERREDGSIYGFGVIIPSLNDEAAEYLRLLEAGVASGVSVDGDSAEFDVQETAEGAPRVEFSSMRLRSLTAVDVPAFNKARIDLGEDGEEEFGGKPNPGTEADLRLTENKKKKKKLGRIVYALTAAGIPVKPKTEWFQDPKFDGPTPITVRSDGSVFGHLALFDTCHIGFPGCVTPPRGSDYKYFHTGEIETDTGDAVDVGHLTFNTGHASMTDSAKAAASHYDHTGSVAADVRAGEDEHGIWISGALRPSLSDEDLRAFRAAPLSGDWRRIAGRLELVGALAVNTPGFPVPRSRTLVASGETETLFTFETVDEDPSGYDEKLRREKREALFHLIGKHDQSAHGAGGGGGSGGGEGHSREGHKGSPTGGGKGGLLDRGFNGHIKPEYSGRKGFREQIKDNKDAVRIARFSEPAMKDITRSNGTLKVNKLKKANLTKLSDTSLKTLNESVDANSRYAQRYKNVSKLRVDILGTAVANKRIKSLGAQQNRIESELKKRGSDLRHSFSLAVAWEFQEDKELTLAEEIEAAKKELEGQTPKPLAADEKADFIADLKDFIAGIKSDPDDEETPEIIAGLEEELKAMMGDSEEASVETETFSSFEEGLRFEKRNQLKNKTI